MSSGGPFGLTEFGMRLFGTIAARPGHRLPDGDVPALAASLDVDELDLRRELFGQASLNLLRFDGAAWKAEDPYACLEAEHGRRRARHAVEDARRAAELEVMERETAAFYSSGMQSAWTLGEKRTTGTLLSGITLLDHAAVWDTIVEHTNDATSSLMFWLAGPVDPNWRSQELLKVIQQAGRRGVTLAALWSSEHIAAAGDTTRLPSWIMRARLDDDLPRRLIIWDERVVLTPTEAGDVSHGGMLIDVPVIVNAFVAQFRQHQVSAAPLTRPQDPSVEERRAATLRGLAADLKDGTIASRLGVDIRTVRRDIEALCQQHGVASRFALGRRTAHLPLDSFGPDLSQPRPPRKRRPRLPPAEVPEQREPSPNSRPHH
ncbi:MAG: hypothetical protein IRZ08_22045 [Frankia sp.]|nr:hypothetical protein [Frankia sp.]